MRPGVVCKFPGKLGLRAVPRGDLRKQFWQVSPDSLPPFPLPSPSHQQLHLNSPFTLRSHVATRQSDSTQCKSCPNRTFADDKGLTRCKVCQAGSKYDGTTLLVTPTANPCTGCPAGTYRDHNRTESSADNECATCDVGKSSAPSASSCTSCAAGKKGRVEHSMSL